MKNITISLEKTFIQGDHVYAYYTPDQQEIKSCVGGHGVFLPIVTTQEDAIAAYTNTAAKAILDCYAQFNDGPWQLDPKYLTQ